MRFGPALAPLWLTGCSLFHNPAASSAMQLGWEVAQQRSALAEAEVRELRTRLDKMDALLRDQGLDGSAGGVSLVGVAEEIAVLRGAVEEVKFQADGVRSDLDQSRVDQERRQLYDEARLAQLEHMLAVQAPPPPRLTGGATAPPSETGANSTARVDPVAPVAPVAPPAPAEELPSDPASRLSLAEQRMAEGKQPAARAILEAAIASAGADAAEVPEMQYRLGETWFNEGKFKEAAKAFQVVTDRYPRSSWAPWSMLSIGECFAQLGRADAAQTFYQGVIRNHPGSEAAAEARARLDK